MAEAGTLHDAFIDELRDTYDAERQLTKALREAGEGRQRRRTAGGLSVASRRDTRARSSDWNRSSRRLEEKVRGKHCDGIAGIIEEGKSIMEEDFDDDHDGRLPDRGGSARRALRNGGVRHLGGVGSRLGHDEAAELLAADPRRRESSG